MNIDRDKILSYVKIQGPIVPTQLTKEFNQNTIIIGAYLSELVKSKKLAVSNLKIGGSPLYYSIEQKYKLVNYSKHLNEKDLQAYDLLKYKQILLDDEQTPLIRFSLRQIKDFAEMIQVIVNNEEKIFWKWFLLSMDEAEKLIRERYFSSKKSEEKTNHNINLEKNVEQRNEKNKINNQNLNEEKLTKEIDIKNSIDLKKEQENNYEKDEDNLIKKEIESKEKVLKAKEELKKQKKDKKKDVLSQKKLDFTNLVEEINDEFHKKILVFFKKHQIKIISCNLIKKNNELEYYLEIPSNIGNIKYYCKAKNKKFFNENDLAGVYVLGQNKKMPVLFVITGEITKKAQEFLEKDYTTIMVCILE
jgi:hypothetical protein